MLTTQENVNVETPLVCLREDSTHPIYAKLELYRPTGSYKVHVLCEGIYLCACMVIWTAIFVTTCMYDSSVFPCLFLSLPLYVLYSWLIKFVYYTTPSLYVSLYRTEWLPSAWTKPVVKAACRPIHTQLSLHRQETHRVPSHTMHNRTSFAVLLSSLQNVVRRSVRMLKSMGQALLHRVLYSHWSTRFDLSFVKTLCV